MTQDTNEIVKPVKQVWGQPDFKELAAENTAGSGGGGPDFASELS